MVVPLTNPKATILVQLEGIAAIACALVWLLLKAAVGLRLTDVGEALGIDQVETGMRAYPEFGETPPRR